jgi:CHAT domain-containing protein
MGWNGMPIGLLVLLVSGMPVLAQGRETPMIGPVTQPEIGAQQQTDEIDRAIAEGWRLFQKGSKESLIAAISQFETALQLSRAKADRLRQAEALLVLGRIYDNLGNKLKALESYNQALPLWQAEGNKVREAATLNNIGSIYTGLGKNATALKYYDSAFQIFFDTANISGQASTLNNVGMVYVNLGKKAEALEYYSLALPLYRTAKQRKGEATALHNIGRVYYTLGEDGKALDFYNQALAIFRDVGDQGGTALVLKNMGAAHAALNNNIKSLDLYNQALPLFQIVGNQVGEADALNGIGLRYYDLGENAKALDSLNQALRIVQGMEDRDAEATVLNSIGLVYNASGKKIEALKFYSQVFPLMRAVENREAQAKTLNNIGALLEQTQPKKAIAFYKQSVNISETLRADIKSLSRNQQSTYTQTISYTYRNLASLLIQQGRLTEAQQVIELLKIRELKEIKSNKSQTQNLIQQLPISEAEKQEIAKVSLEIAREIQAEALPTPDRLSPTNSLNQSAQTLLTDQPNAVLIYQLFTQDKLWLILITPDGKLQRFASTANQAKIESIATAFRRQIEQCENENYICDQTDTKNLNKISQELHQQLFPADLQTALKAAKSQHLILALDGSLRNIPIAALHTGQQYLVEQYTLSSIIAAQLTDSQDKLPTNPLQSPILAVGTSKQATIPVPDYVDADRQDQYAGLGNVPIELNAIVSTSKSPSAFPGHQLLDDQFTLPNLRQQLPQHRLFHIGSHAIFRPNFLDYSYILMGNNQPWSIAQMDSESNGKLFQNIHMVTLSACQSGLGGRDKTGIEIAGMSHAFLSQGAKTVTATLWKVHDQSTAMLMQRFYQNLAKTPNQSKAKSLQAAQLYLLQTPEATLSAQRSRWKDVSDKKTPASPPPSPKTADYTHPYYWAAFTLIGNSR